MSSFHNRQQREADMFDVKKRFGALIGGGTSSVETRTHNSDEGEKSWVELAPSRASLCSSVEAMVMVDDGNGESSVKDSRLSPVSLQSPHGVEFESNLEQVKYRLFKDIKNMPSTDWIWDWSSRPEKQEPSKMSRNRSGQQIGSTLTTPPNSPEPELSSEFDFRTGKIQKPTSMFLRFEVIVGMVVSCLTGVVIGTAIGFCLCKKMNTSESVKVNYYYW
ncbi:BNIP3 domain-containing protein [Ditylenchus destructor]|nr:BNIP3 domain-containing protein [Ditylenchus destructor]